jgi:hypothetical protein
MVTWPIVFGHHDRNMALTSEQSGRRDRETERDRERQRETERVGIPISSTEMNRPISKKEREHPP